MWILPKNLSLPPSSFVLDMEAFISESNESSQICGQSLFVRSKPTPARTWLRKWKKDSWTQRLFGRILKPSHGQSFLTEWTSLWEATPASLSQVQESGSAKTTPATSGRGSQKEFDFFAPEPVSSKTLKDTSRWDSPQSSAIWKNWVTRCRGEYSARLKSAPHTGENGSLSWPTIRAQEPGLTSPGYGRGLAATVEEKYAGLADPDSHSSTGNHQGSCSWPTASTSDAEGGPQLLISMTDSGFRCEKVNRPGEFFGAKLRDAVETHELWQTPDVGSVEGGRTARGQSEPHKASLEKQAKHESWPSPTSRDWKGERGGADRGFGADLNDVVQKEWLTPRACEIA